MPANLYSLPQNNHRWKTFPSSNWKSKALKVTYTFLKALPEVLSVCFWSHNATSSPLVSFLILLQLQLQVANIILCLIPLLSKCAAVQLQMNSVSTDHEITCCDLFAYILKNQVMLVQICEEGVGGEKRKNLSCLQSINSATCCLTLQGALLFSPYLLSIYGSHSTI